MTLADIVRRTQPPHDDTAAVECFSLDRPFQNAFKRISCDTHREGCLEISESLTRPLNELNKVIKKCGLHFPLDRRSLRHEGRRTNQHQAKRDDDSRWNPIHLIKTSILKQDLIPSDKP